MRHLVAALLVVLLLGCSKPEMLISEQEATETATQIAITNDLHFFGSLEPPTNIRAEVKTLSTAKQDLLAKGYSFNIEDNNYTPETKVWVVSMDGYWPRNFPPLLPNEPTREPWHYLKFVLDAKTGDLITISVPE